MALRNVRVAAEVPKSASAGRFAKDYVVSGTLKAGHSTTVAMGVKLSDFNVELKKVRGQARSAEVAE